METYFRPDGVPSHYHTDVRNFLEVRFPGRWTGRRGSVENSLQSPDLKPVEFSLVLYLYLAFRD
jgi:hypothetical protein